MITSYDQISADDLVALQEERYADIADVEVLEFHQKQKAITSHQKNGWKI